MAPTNPSRRSVTPPTDRAKSPSHNVLHGFERHEWHLGMPNEPAREPYHFHKHSTKPHSREHSAPPSGATTPERQAHSERQHYNFFKHLNERLDRAYAGSSSRPEADKVVEEAKHEGEAKHGKKGGDLFKFIEGRLDRAHERGRLTKQ